MRSLLAAAVVVALSGLILARASRAEPPQPEEPRKVADIIAAVAKEPGRRSALASLRWYLEVNGQDAITVPAGSPLTTLGQWGDHHAELGAISGLGGCKPMPEKEKKAALALLEEFGDDLTPPLRAGALAQAGKAPQAVALFTEWATARLPAAGCPSEHPMYSHRRVGLLKTATACVETLDPKSPSLAKLKKLIDRAQSCAANNHAVG